MSKLSTKEAQLCVTSERREVVFTEEETKRMKVEIGNRIAEAFNYRADTEIASLLKLSNKTVKSFTAGEEFPTIEILLSIHRLTGVSLDWVLTGKETRQESYAQCFAVNEPAILGLA